MEFSSLSSHLLYPVTTKDRDIYLHTNQTITYTHTSSYLSNPPSNITNNKGNQPTMRCLSSLLLLCCLGMTTLAAPAPAPIPSPEPTALAALAPGALDPRAAAAEVVTEPKEPGHSKREAAPMPAITARAAAVEANTKPTNPENSKRAADPMPSDGGDVTKRAADPMPTDGAGGNVSKRAPSDPSNPKPSEAPPPGVSKRAAAPQPSGPNTNGPPRASKREAAPEPQPTEGGGNVSKRAPAPQPTDQKEGQPGVSKRAPAPLPETTGGSS